MTTRPLIAVVDDDRVFTEMIGEVLDSEGYDTIVIGEAETAVEDVVRAKPALVLLDVRMDRVESGVAILDGLRQHPEGQLLPVVVCTADQQFLRTRAEYLESQRAATVAKPFDLDEVLAAIRHGLGE